MSGEILSEEEVLLKNSDLVRVCYKTNGSNSSNFNNPLDSVSDEMCSSPLYRFIDVGPEKTLYHK